MASIKVLLNLKKKNKKGDSPLFIRIIKNRKTKYISLGIYLNVDYWDKENQRVRKNYANSGRVNAYIAKKVAEAEAAVVDLETNSRSVRAQEIKEKIMGTPPVDFLLYADKYVTSLEVAGKIGTYKRAKSVIKKLKDYSDGKPLYFQDITVTFLKDYESYLIKELSNRTNTIHSNYRIIRKIFNDAIREDKITRDDNPFYKYILKSEKTKREYLTEEEIKSIENLSLPEDNIINTHRNIYVFSSYTGLRISDVLTLKWENFDGERINLQMRKTQNSLSIKLPKKALEIISIYRTAKSKPSQFIFPLLSDKIDYSSNPKELHRAISAATAYTNKSLNEIAFAAKIKKHLSFHTSRHTFATSALRKGIRIEYVSKLLGHANIKETQIYAKIVNEELEKAMEVFNS